ncbi:MAG: SulP family inorganic anion transporter, partial [Burkholderiales bacterium]
MNKIARYFPFLSWFPPDRSTLRADLVAGITVALVLVPQSMAYAQLAGLPAYYGLYAAFLPVIVGALWGSSRQLATGPVAMVSLLTGAALAPLAATGSEQLVAMAILLALMVGIIQLSLGLFKLGLVVNFLSHPVVIGFTNAAAIIIALSQLNKLLGLSSGRSEHFFVDIWGVLVQLGETHWPTLMMGLLAIGMLMAFKRFWPRAPGVLITVAITTLLSWAIGYEHNTAASIEQTRDPEVRLSIESYDRLEDRMRELKEKNAAKSAQLRQIEESGGSRGVYG